MSRVFTVLGALSTLTLLALGITAAWWAWSSPEDAGFLRDYLLRFEPDEREHLRAFTAKAAEQGEITDEALNDFLIDEELRKRLAENQALESVVLANITRQRENRESRQDTEQAALDRMAARRDALDDERLMAERKLKEAADKEEKYDRLLREWNDKQRNEFLGELVRTVDKSREPETLLAQLENLPLSDLFYVLYTSKNQNNRAAIIDLLPPETRRGLAEVGSNPAGLPEEDLAPPDPGS